MKTFFLLIFCSCIYLSLQFDELIFNSASYEEHDGDIYKILKCAG